MNYGSFCALHKISGTFQEGSLTAVVGPNGGGKSTLIKTINGLLKPASGRIIGAKTRRKNLAYMPQQSILDHHFPITVREVAAMGLSNMMAWHGGYAASHLEKIDAALASVGLSGLESRLIDSLSGGQFQRLLFARLILQDSPIVILDEPFSSIDLHTKKLLLSLIKSWHDKGKTIIVVMHELDLVKAHFPQTLLLARAVIHWGATSVALSQENMSRAFETFVERKQSCTTS